MGYSNSDVAHAWAHGLDKCHRGSSFAHYSDGCLLSYSTCIAQRLEVNGQTVYVVNTYSYSSSTAKHQSYARQAIPEGATVFACDLSNYSRGSLLYDASDRKQFGLRYLMESLCDCVALRDCNTLQHSFSRDKYEKMVRWFEVTGDTTVKKLLRLKLADFERWLPTQRNYSSYGYDAYRFKPQDVKKFLRLMSENVALEEICDAVNGKGTWDAYQARIQSLRDTQRNRQFSMWLGYKMSNMPRWNTPKIDGKYEPRREGSITKAVIKKHNKDGHRAYLKWLLEEKRANRLMAINSYEAEQRANRLRTAIYKLERACGWTFRYHYIAGKAYQALDSFDYNGTVICFRNRHYLKERSINERDYAQFKALSQAEQKQWIHDRKAWMLEQIMQDEADHRRYELEKEERVRLLEQECLEREIKNERDREYIVAKKAEGESGVRDLWHEGYSVTLPSNSIAFYHGGNALLRKNALNVETSKGIRISFDECKRLWAIVSRWHNRAVEFVAGEQVRATLHNWTISTYQNDIMIAGCHAIAYSEMEYIAQQLGLI